ncbi:MAG TPA: hypothetical protein VEX38_00515, partial [Fimbriimonadaceae bacterium]|nr:hypothetical protein [Fimbriimonadaceae bacterium]
MSEYIGWYTVELRLRLGNHLPAAKIESIVKEAGSHLRESAENLKNELGLSDDASALAAIEAFGTPEAIAISHLQQVTLKVFGMPSAAFALLCSTIAILCWDYHWLSLSGPFDNYGATWQNGICGVVGFVALAGLVAAIARSKRRLLAPIAASVLGCMLILPLMATYLAVPGGASYEAVLRPNLREAETTIPYQIRQLEKLDHWLQAGAKRYAQSKDGSDLPTSLRSVRAAEKEFGLTQGSSYPVFTSDGRVLQTAYTTPRNFIYAPARGGLWIFEGAATFEEAKATWAKESQNAIFGANVARQELREMLANVKKARSGKLFFFNPFLITEIVMMTFTLGLGLLLL